MVVHKFRSLKSLKTISNKIDIKSSVYTTDGNNILHTLLVKHYSDLLERHSSERDKDEVSYFYVEDGIHLVTKYAGV